MDSLTSNLAAIVLVLAGIGLVVMFVMQSMQVSALRRRIDALTGGAGEGNLEDVLIQHLESVHAVGQDLDELVARVAFLESSARHHYSRQGLVRFDSSMFPDTGGKQSFALALLDEANDGYVMTSLHSRTGTRLYAKAVTAGKTDQTLSTEETQAIQEAMARRFSSTTAARGRGRTTAAAGKPSGRGSGSSRSASIATSAGATEPAPVAEALPAEEAALAPEPVLSESLPEEPGDALFQPDDEPAHEIVRRPAVSKGQSKSEAGDVPVEADAERTGARPGRSGGR